MDTQQRDQFTAAARSASHDAARAFDQLASAVATAFMPVMEQVGLGLEAFGEAWCRLAEHTYLEHHQRLPGSLRTARLRKKRRTKVMEWFSDYLKQHSAK